MGGNAILYQGRIFIKDGLDNDMTAKKRILAFEIGTFFTRYVVFEDGRVYVNAVPFSWNDEPSLRP